MKFSQNNEEEIILNYFGDKVGVFADFGSNDGITLSNSHSLALFGWKGICIEPSPDAFMKLQNNYLNNENVYCLNVAVSNYIGKADFFDSGTHLNKGDTSLLSSLDEKEIKRWGKTTTFNKIKVDVDDFKTLLNLSPYKKFGFISIDAEGNDLIILRQMDLKELGCQCLCIEHNGNKDALKEIREICSGYGLGKELLYNAENIILASDIR